MMAMEMEMAAKRRRGDAGDGDGDGSDRISQLPEPVLNHILCFLSHKKAVQTSVLSKSWRHLGPTRPLIDLRGSCRRLHYNFCCEYCFMGINEEFMSVLENTFQRYHDRNLSPQELSLQMLEVDSQSNSLLQKWIPIFIKPNSPLTTFRLAVDNFKYIPSEAPDSWPRLDLPSAVFKAESLENLYLQRCKISSLIENVVLTNLQRLSLSRAYIDDEALKRIMSGCPSLEYAELSYCKGLKSISVANENRYLKDFKSVGCYAKKIHPPANEVLVFDLNVIQIEAPTVRSIHIERCLNWKLDRSNFFPHLRSLYLLYVQLSTESFEIFSCNFPLLEKFELRFCGGFEEIKLFSHSLKHLTIALKSSIKVDIDAPNILRFRFSGGCFPTTLYLTAASREKSQITLGKSGFVYGELVMILIETERLV